MSDETIKLMGGNLPTVKINFKVNGNLIEWIHRFGETWVLADYRRVSPCAFVQWEKLSGPIGYLP